MTYKQAIFLLGILLFTSCSIEELIERKEERIIGTWEIDRARFNGDGFSSGDNLINEYRGDLLTFFEGGELEYIDNNGEIFTGTWYLDALRGGEDGTDYTLDADFYDTNGDLAFRWLGDISRLTFKNFNINISDRDGELRLRWDKR